MIPIYVSVYNTRTKHDVVHLLSVVNTQSEKMTYTYQYPHPAVTTDIVIFTVRLQKLEVLLIRRKLDPFRDCWAIPGGFLDLDEDLDACAARELEEETGIRNVYLEQLYTFGKVGRDPRERVISVAYYALAPMDDQNIQAGDDAAETRWFDVDELPKLAFDHRDILNVARQRLTDKMEYSSVGLQLMPDEFTLTRLQQVYETASGQPRDKRNFRKWILGLDLVEETGNKLSEGAYRPAKLYRVKDRSKIRIIK